MYTLMNSTNLQDYVVVYLLIMQFILLTHLLRKHCVAEAYSAIIKDRVTADREQDEGEPSGVAASLRSATDVAAESGADQKQAATKVASSFVEQSKSSEHTQGHTTMDIKLLQLCEIFPDVPLENVKSFLVASGYNTELAAGALSNATAPTSSSQSSSGTRPPPQSMHHGRTAPQIWRAVRSQPTSHDQDLVSPPGIEKPVEGT